MNEMLVVRESFVTLCCAHLPKIPCSCYTLTVRSHVLSYLSPDVLVCPGQPEPIQARGCPCLLLYRFAFRDHLSIPGTMRQPGEGDQLLFKTTEHPVRGSPACGIVPRVIAGALRACNMPGCVTCAVRLQCGLPYVTSCAATGHSKAARQDCYTSIRLPTASCFCRRVNSRIR